MGYLRCQSAAQEQPECSRYTFPCCIQTAADRQYLFGYSRIAGLSNRIGQHQHGYRKDSSHTKTDTFLFPHCVRIKDRGYRKDAVLQCRVLTIPDTFGQASCRKARVWKLVLQNGNKVV